MKRKVTLTPKTRGPGERTSAAGGPAQVVGIRVHPDDIATIKKAAALDRRTVSQFIGVAAIERAERMLAAVEAAEPVQVKASD